MPVYYTFYNRTTEEEEDLQTVNKYIMELYNSTFMYGSEFCLMFESIVDLSIRVSSKHPVFDHTHIEEYIQPHIATATPSQLDIYKKLITFFKQYRVECGR